MSDFDYESYDAVGLAALVAAGELTPTELLDAALARVATRNPAINAVVLEMEEAARTAIEAGLPNGPLRGVPFLLKDLHLLVDGQPTTSGSRLFQDFVADHDSELVARYRRAGLVLFAKTTSPEFGLTTTTESTLFGATRNPWNLDHTSGGSSGGASAAVAARIVPAANASDGGGSIRIPASCAGLFGLKPTRGRTPMGPDAGEGWSGMSCVHAVTRSVRDSAVLLDATAGPDVGAPYWAPEPSRPFAAEVGESPGRLRIAVQTATWNGAPVHADCAAALEDGARLCEELGHEVVDAPFTIDAALLREATGVIIGANLRAAVLDRAASLGRDFTQDDLEPLTYAMAVGAAARSASEYAGAVRSIHALGRQLGGFLEAWDVMLTPTMATPPLRIGELSLAHPELKVMLEGLGKTVGFTQLLNATGHPAMSVPLAWNDAGLPIGLQFVGRYANEATLFRLAAQLEEARPWFERRPPSLE
jgi:amidase/6-aminohexanoate-cyclic-dimer hydrolase